MNCIGIFFFIDFLFKLTNHLFIFIIMSIIGLLSYLINSYLIYSIAKKTNMDHSWIAWIPVINNYLLLKYANIPQYIMIIYFILYCIKTSFICLLISNIIFLYAIWKISKNHNCESIILLILGYFIPLFIWVQLYKIVKNIDYNYVI